MNTVSTVSNCKVLYWAIRFYLLEKGSLWCWLIIQPTSFAIFHVHACTTQTEQSDWRIIRLSKAYVYPIAGELSKPTTVTPWFFQITQINEIKRNSWNFIGKRSKRGRSTFSHRGMIDILLVNNENLLKPNRDLTFRGWWNNSVV